MAQRPAEGEDGERERLLVLNLRVSKSERERLKRAAKANHQTFSQFARDALGEAASETLEDDDEDQR